MIDLFGHGFKRHPGDLVQRDVVAGKGGDIDPVKIFHSGFFQKGHAKDYSVFLPLFVPVLGDGHPGNACPDGAIDFCYRNAQHTGLCAVDSDTEVCFWKFLGIVNVDCPWC